MSNQQKNTGLDFNASEHEPARAIDILPNGWYNAEITDAEVLACKGVGNNERVSIEYTVIDGDHKGRKVWDSINHNHSKAQTQEIGQRELSAVCHATGVMQLSSAAGGVAQFVGKMLQIKVGTGKTTAAYPDPKNEVKGRKALANAANNGGAGQSPPPFAQPAAQETPPFASPTQAPPAVPAVPAAPPVVETPAVNPIDTAVADGWIAHPSSPGFYYKGQEVVSETDLAGRYPATPQTPPAAPQAPVAIPSPAAPVAGGVPAVPTGGPPAWAQQ